MPELPLLELALPFVLDLSHTWSRCYLLRALKNVKLKQMSFDFNANTEKQKTNAFSIIFDNITSNYHLYKPSADVLAISTNLGFSKRLGSCWSKPMFCEEDISQN